MSKRSDHDRAETARHQRNRRARLRAARPLPEWMTDETIPVYFITDETGHVKIGLSKQPEVRRAELQCGNPTQLRIVHTETGGLAREQELHAQFAADRAIGEWFRLSDAILAYLASGNSG